MRRLTLLTLCLTGALGCLLAAAPAIADGELKWMVDIEEEAVERRQATPDEVTTHATALKKAARKKDPKEVLAALEAVTEFHHEDFVKPMLKLTLHKSGDVSSTAA